MNTRNRNMLVMMLGLGLVVLGFVLGMLPTVGDCGSPFNAEDFAPVDCDLVRYEARLHALTVLGAGVALLGAGVLAAIFLERESERAPATQSG